jgi:HK97 gp10 family phage protein
MAIKVTNMNQFEQGLKRTSIFMQDEVRAAIAQSADEVVATQRRLAPVDDGDLRDSIIWQWDNKRRIKYSQQLGGTGQTKLRGLGYVAVITVGNTKVRYAHLVEFGTGPHKQGGQFKGTMHPGTVAQPFFFPGFRLVRKRIKSRISRAVNKAIRKAGLGK